jgi:hypothetical protein
MVCCPLFRFGQSRARVPVGTTRPDIVDVPLLEVEVGRDVVVRMCVTVIVAESEPVVFVCGVMGTALSWSACYIG